MVQLVLAFLLILLIGFPALERNIPY